MKKSIKLLLAGVLVPVAAFGVVAGNMEVANAATLKEGIGAATGDGMVTKELTGQNGMVTDVVNFMLYAVGILSVVMLIWGGIRYTTSAGDSSKVTAAKNTILYAIIGIVVSVLAYAVVNFVLKQVGSSAGA